MEIFYILTRVVFIYVHMQVCCLFSHVQLCNPVDQSLPGSSVHGILQARILEWVAMSFSRNLLKPGIEPTSLTSPALISWFFTTSTTWAIYIYVCVCVCVCVYIYIHICKMLVHTHNV